jgi:hypothetical protein
VQVRLKRELALIVKSVSPMAAAKNLYLRYAVDPDVPEVVLIDPLRIHQILNNLLSNAISTFCVWQYPMSPDFHSAAHLCCWSQSSHPPAA